jgi:glycosyltransferase involved in cell wall biosynthesis
MPSKISLVMTVYNREVYLPQALDSILAQTYPHWQLTLWDDGSTDASPEIAREYASRDPRIQFVPAAHTGRIPAINAAIQVTNLPYLAFVDSDDLLDPAALATTVKILDTHPHVGMVYSDYLLIDEHNRSKGIGARCQIPYSKERLLVDFMTFHFRLLRREVYDRAGGIDLAFQSAEDYDLCLKVSEVTQIHHLQVPLYYYREHSDSISQLGLQAQTEYSGRAVRNALSRRGLANRYQLSIDPSGRFTVKKRSKVATQDKL